MNRSMRVFDNGPWELPGGADHLVSHFDYLNSSARVEAARVRAVVERMFDHYPAPMQQALRRRLRSVDNNIHLSAFFELVVHDLLLRSECRVLAVEPDVDDTLRSPDFLAETPQGQRFYVEATLASGRSRSEKGADRRLKEALQAIDSVHSPDYFLELHIAGVPAAPVSGGRLRRALERWLSSLNYQQVRRIWDESDERPVFHHEQHGVRFKILPIPRRASRGTPQRGRAIGMRMPEAQWVQPQEAIKKAILAKAARYGQLDAPYLIAINAMEDHADEESAVDAVFGKIAVSVRRTPSGLVEHTGRDGGAWRGRSGPVNTRVSGIVSTERLTPWSLAQCRARLLLNPWSRYPLPQPPFPIDFLAVRHECLHRTEGLSVREIFRLPEGWPE
jgi:hypothetical protein